MCIIFNMKAPENIRLYAWAEFALWLFIIAFFVFGIRYHHYLKQKQFKSYQIFMNDVDGLIVGSPVKFLGIQIGYVKKIQLVSSNVYIKFIITQKDLELPVGAVATVEGSGLGGSKALEIYPPEDKNPDRIIQTKDVTRLGKVMGLFKDIFRDFDQIFASFNYASKQLEEDAKEMPMNVVMPESMNKGLDYVDKTIDNIQDANKKLKEQIKPKKRGEVENGFEQSEGNN